MLELEANLAALKEATRWRTYLRTILQPIQDLAIEGVDRGTLEALIGTCQSICFSSLLYIHYSENRGKRLFIFVPHENVHGL